MEITNNSFYRNYIEIEKDIESLLGVLFNNSDLIINYTEEVLFEKGELQLRKFVISNNESILSYLRGKIKGFILQKESKKEWKVYTNLDTEIESCSSKAQSLLEASDIRNEKKMNIRLSSLVGKELFAEINYGSIIKEYLSMMSKELDDIDKEIISEVAKNIALKWYPIYSKNVENINDDLVKKGIRKDIKDEEINIKPKIEKRNPISVKNDWSMQKKVENIFDEKRANTEIEMKGCGSENKVESKELYEMISDLMLKDEEIKNLYKNKRIISPSNFVKNIENIEKENIYGFEKIKSVFANEIIPKENLSILKMIADLFEVIIEDENLNSENKLLLCKLQFPIIKTSLLNKEQIIKDDSTVNEVMKKLTNEIKLMSNYNSHAYKNIKEKIEDFSKIKFDNISYREILKKWEDFLLFLDKNERRVSLIETRNREKELGLYYFEQAEKELKKDLSSILLDAEFVDVDSCFFIEKDIKNNLMVTKLKDLKDKTNNYEKQKIILEMWFNALFVFNNKEDGKKYSQMLYKVLVQNNSTEKQKYSDGIKRTYQKVVSKKEKIEEKEKEDFQKEKYNNYTQVFKEFDLDKTIVEKNTSPEFNAFEKLEYGDWLEIYEGEFVKNCKLLLKLNNNKKFIFVDTNGVQNLESTINELMKMHEDKKLKVLEKNTVMERALDKILLRN